jgi:hypothetical protein
MAALGFLLLAVIIFLFGWNKVGVADAKTTSVIAGAAALLMGASVVFQGATIFGTASTAPIGALLLLWAIYGALVAGLGFWDVSGGRALGLYALLLSLAMIAFAVWFGANGSIAGVIVTLAVAIPFFLQFIEYIVPIRQLAGLVGFLLLIAGVISGASGIAVYLHMLA